MACKMYNFSGFSNTWSKQNLVRNMNKTGVENDCGIITGVVPASFWLFAFTLYSVRIPEVFAKVN